LPAPATPSSTSSNAGGGGGGGGGGSGGGEFVYPSKKEPSQEATNIKEEKHQENPQQPVASEEAKEKRETETAKEATNQKTTSGLTGFAVLNIIQKSKSLIGIGAAILLLLGAGILLIKKPRELSPDEYYHKSAQLQKKAKEQYMKGDIEEANELYKKSEEFRSYARK